MTSGSVKLAAVPTVSHDSGAVAAMRAGCATMNAPPYSARLGANACGHFAKGFPVSVPLDGPLPPNVTAYWTTAVLSSSDNSGARVTGSVLSDSYARAFMVKGRDAVFTGNTFRRAGGIHIGPEQNWLEGDPGIEDVRVEGNRFEEIGTPPVQINEGVPPGRKIVVRNNSNGRETMTRVH